MEIWVKATVNITINKYKLYKTKEYKIFMVATCIDFCISNKNKLNQLM